jgi:hypothetical protein
MVCPMNGQEAEVDGGDDVERRLQAGAVAAWVLKSYPQSSAVCVDFAEGCMAVGERYLAPFADRYRFVYGDLNALTWTGWLDTRFDSAGRLGVPLRCKPRARRVCCGRRGPTRIRLRPALPLS